MKLLFLVNHDIKNEHVFIMDEWREMAHMIDDCCLGQIIFTDDETEYQEVEDSSYGRPYYKLLLPRLVDNDLIVENIARFFCHIKPDLIHSNSALDYDVKAAQRCNIPIVLTIHVGGVVCPRSQTDGFLTYKDTLCDVPVSERCLRCCCENLPLPAVSYTILRMLPRRWLINMYNKMKYRHIPYVSAALSCINAVATAKDKIDILKYATLIAANGKLVELLRINGLDKNVRLIPHGVAEGNIHQPVSIKSGNPVKFFYLGRIQRSKGVHIILEALRGIDKNKYEFHILGDGSRRSRHSRRYLNKIQDLAKGQNVIFHGEVKHDDINTIIKQCHVNIHSAMYLEVYGLTIAESLSIGRPVLATRCGGAEMQIMDGVNGWLIEPNNVKQMHDKICDLIDNTKMIEEASKHCRLPHPLPQYILKLKELYKELANKN